MTPVGVALIVGGITTLIVLRAALFGGASQDERPGETRRRAGAVVVPPEGASAGGRRDASGTRRSRRRAATAGSAAQARSGSRADRKAGVTGARSATAGPGQAGVTRSRSATAGPGQAGVTRSRSATADPSQAQVTGARSATTDPGPPAPGDVRRAPRKAARTKAANRTRSAGRSGPGQVPATFDRADGPGPRPGPDAVVPEPRRNRRSRRAAPRTREHPAATGADPAGVPLSAAEPHDEHRPAGMPGPWPMLNNARPPSQPVERWEQPGPWPEPAEPYTELPESPAEPHGEALHDGPGSRRYWPTTGTPAPEELPPWPPQQPALEQNAFEQNAFEERTGPGPTDFRLLSMAAPGDDPGEPADEGGDPELDIDQDLDRAAEVVEEPDQSQAMALPGFGLPGADDGPAADLSGPFDAVDGTSAYSGFLPDAVLEDADETHPMPVSECAFSAPDWADRDDLQYADRVEDWVRPEYEEEPAPAAGEYWTPVPTGSHGPGYGWPTPVERLPEVPERLMPQWPPARPDDRVEVPRSWPPPGATGPAFRTAVERDRPVGLRAVPDPVEEPAGDPGRFGDAAFHPPEGTTGRRRFDEPRPAGDDRVFLGDQGLVLAAMPDDEPVVPAEEITPVPSRSGRVPARHGPNAGEGPYAAREQSLEGPFWSVPDLPDAALPDLTWAPGGPADTGGVRRGRRPSGRIRRRRSAGGGEDPTQALPPTDSAPADQPRPRPRPRPGPGPPESRSTVYVSRHAAEPS